MAPLGLIAVAWSIHAVTCLGLAIASPGFPVVVLWALCGVYHGVSDAVGKALVADVVPPAQRATGYGILRKPSNRPLPVHGGPAIVRT